MASDPYAGRIDPYVLEGAELDLDDDEEPPRDRAPRAEEFGSRTAPNPATSRPAEPRPEPNGPTDGELLELVPGAVVLRAIAVARRAGLARPTDPKASLELARLRLALLGPLSVVAAHGDRRGLVAVLAAACRSEPVAEVVRSELERAIAAAEKALPRFEETGAPPRRNPK